MRYVMNESAHTTVTGGSLAPPGAQAYDIRAAMREGIPVPVACGRHSAASDEACLMELASLFASEPWSDHPASVHPVLAAVARAINDRVSDGARELLSPLVPQMTGTADVGPDGHSRPERCARLVLQCTGMALEASPFMAAEMESARLTALSVLSRPGAAAPAETEPTDARKNGTAVRRHAAALLDRLGLLNWLYASQAAIQAAQAVSIIAGAATGPAAQRDVQLCRLLRACTALCAGDAAVPHPARQAGDSPRSYQAAAVGGEMQQHGRGQTARTCPPYPVTRMLRPIGRGGLPAGRGR
jgi:hypothetical protein